MPSREDQMSSVEEYLGVREEARRPPGIQSASPIGISFVVLGAAVLIVVWSLPDYDLLMLRYFGYMFLAFGTAFLIMGKRGGARYRVTETTRYPQQTGEIHDLFFQILGEKYLWIVVALMIALVSLLAWRMS